MPWHYLNCPAVMNGLPAPVREKAIEIANALLREGYDDGTATRIAVAKAKEWALHHGWDPDTLEIPD